MFKKKLAAFIERIKKLRGDPHYVAMGMAIGVFIAITPTIPFHGTLALALALLLRASKSAALVGIWVSNPITIIPFYYLCYKVGCLFMNDSSNSVETIDLLISRLESDAGFMQKIDFLLEFIKSHFDVFLYMNLGGLILGIPAGIVGYYLTKKFVVRLRSRERKGTDTI